MKGKTIPVLICAGLAVFLAAACSGQKFSDWSQTPKIVSVRVVSDAAVLRLAADPKAEIVADKIAKGTVYANVRKTGSWYRIQHRSAIGALLVAFIHESEVEAIAEPPGAPDKK